ncbi:MAG: UDP-N-acetylmuramate--L-alanine ligase [Endozoicomonadaceae bacterium]|nr:UDP-N-acetylmuramate--L-alanine ligase [Endozoicomonadaceae bacterium]
MNTFTFNPFQISAKRIIHTIHFIGIGGAGMCGLAEVLYALKYHITGSDIDESINTKHLQKIGITVYPTHHKKNIQAADLIITSTAIQSQNLEIIAAKKAKIPIIKRAKLLAQFMLHRESIAIAGTHGKTTTTALISEVFNQANLSPTIVIGGKLKSTLYHGQLGTGPLFIAEADESDASFLDLNPHMIIITNIEPDHMETYQHSVSKLKTAFLNFLQHRPEQKLAILYADDDIIQSLLPQIKQPFITYGFQKQAHIRAVNMAYHEMSVTFDILDTRTQKYITIQSHFPGQHNILNMLATYIIAKHFKISDDCIQKSLLAFQGVARRFEYHGLITMGEHQSIVLLEDYGHHPTEIKAMIEAVQLSWPNKRIVMIFQPHRYSRTQDLLHELSTSFQSVDLLLLLEVYPAGETKRPKADSQTLHTAIQANNPQQVCLLTSLKKIKRILKTQLQDNDILILQGAGDISTLVPLLK